MDGTRGTGQQDFKRPQKDPKEKNRATPKKAEEAQPPKRDKDQGHPIKCSRLGGVVNVPGCSSTHRARPSASNGVESSWPPQGALQRQSAHEIGGGQSVQEIGGWQSVHVTGGLQSVHVTGASQSAREDKMPMVKALQYHGDPDDPIEDEESETDPGAPFPHGGDDGNEQLQRVGRLPPGFKAPPAIWWQHQALNAPQPSVCLSVYLII